MPRRKSNLFVAGFVCALLAGCAVGPNYHAPKVALPNGFAPDADAQKASTNNAVPTIDATQWWQAFSDPELNSLIARAVQGNLDLQIALDRMQEARTQEAVVLGTALPDVEASAGAGRGTGSDLARGRAGQPLISADKVQPGMKQITQVVGFDGGWELDLFGQYRRELEATKADTGAAIAARNGVLLSVVGDVARAYIDMRALQMRLAVLQKNTDVARQYLDVTQERFNRGITNELDLTLAKRELATLQSESMPLTSQIRAAQYVIAVLLGKFPEDLAKEFDQPQMLPALPENIAAGLPLDLLRRRPDVIEAERRLAGATARIGVATANLFPHVGVSGAVGYEGQGLGVSPAISSSIWSVGPSASWSVLDFGTLDGLVKVANYRAREALLNYKQTVLNAVREVDTSLGLYTAQQDELRNLDQALTASQRAMSLASQRYDRGLTDALNVIDAERQEYTLEEQYVSAQQAAADQFIALYKALGGGWEQYQSFPKIKRPQPAVLAAFTHLFKKDDGEPTQPE